MNVLALTGGRFIAKDPKFFLRFFSDDFRDHCDKFVVNQPVADDVPTDLAFGTIFHRHTEDVGHFATGFLDNELHGSRFPTAITREDGGFELSRGNQSAEISDRARVHPFGPGIHEFFADVMELVAGIFPPDHADVGTMHSLMFGHRDRLAVAAQTWKPFV